MNNTVASQVFQCNIYRRWIDFCVWKFFLKSWITSSAGRLTCLWDVGIFLSLQSAQQASQAARGVTDPTRLIGARSREVLGSSLVEHISHFTLLCSREIPYSSPLIKAGSAVNKNWMGGFSHFSSLAASHV